MFNGSYNSVTLVGNIGQDPKVNRKDDGSVSVMFSLATTESYVSNGERKTITEWHNIVVYNERIAKLASEYLKKGAKVLVNGKIKTNEYTNKDGVLIKDKQILLDKFGGHIEIVNNPNKQQDSDSSNEYAEKQYKPKENKRDIDDDIPF